MQNAVARIQGVSRTDFQKALPAVNQATTTATPGNNQKRCCYGLSAELALQSGVSMGHKLIDISA